MTTREAIWRRQLRWFVNVVFNITNESFVAIKLAKVSYARRKADKAGDLPRKSVEFLAENWNVVAGQKGDDWKLSRIEEMLAEVLEIARGIDVERIIELREHRASTKEEFEDKVSSIRKLTGDEYAISIGYYLQEIRENPREYSGDALRLVQKTEANNKRLRRFILLVRLPIVRWLGFFMRLRWIILASFLAIFAFYFIFALLRHQTDEAYQIQRIPFDDMETARQTWRQLSNDGFWARTRATIETLNQTASLVPLALFFCSAILALVRNFVVSENRIKGSLLSVQQQFDSISKYLGAGRAPAIIFGGVTMSNNTYTASHGGVIITAEYMKDVTNSVVTNFAASNASDEVKALGTELASEIQKIAPSVGPQHAQNLIVDEQSLSAELAGSSRKDMLKVFLENIKKTASAVGEIGGPVFAVAEKLYPLLSN
ncbi:hypothetical protein SBC2_82850 (plasmid) [Caballeronia sp. SBC2]|nr:hypothetical protein SBC2_82850 [Caballeronia sp. SBC2]